MATTYLTRTFTNTGNRKIYTTSFWVKRSGLSSGQSPIFSSDYNNSNDYYSMMYFTNDFLAFYSKDNTTTLQFLTNARFRDVNGWYNIVIAFDTTQTTASNRVKFYVNGEQITSFDTATYPPLDADNTWFNRNWEHVIGRRSYDGATYFDGSLSHFNFIDGTAYDASAFGSTDSTTGEWVITTNPSVTYGTNGFFILKDGNSVTDQSGNSNNWTVGGGTLTKTEDCPSNVFTTMNPLSAGSNMAFTYGNTGIRNDAGSWQSGLSTIAAGTGKYYWEVYVYGGGDNNTGVSLASAYGGTHSEVDAGRIVYSRNGYIYREGLSGQGNVSTGVTYGDGDYIGVSFDTENGILTFYKNGSAVTNGSTTDTSFLSSNNEYAVQCGLYNGGEFRFNFGNGAFGSTQLTGTTYSGDGGNGIFKYQPPTGFTALSTKGLNL